MDQNALKQSEAEFKAKYGNPMVGTKPLGNRPAGLGNRPMGLGPRPNLMNNFLAQRLNNAKGQQFFDSGDYNMNKNQNTGNSRPIYLPMQNQLLQQNQNLANKENTFKKPE